MDKNPAAAPLEPSNYIHLPLMVRADGGANKFHLIDANGNWLMAVLHNGEPNTYAVQKNMEFLVRACNTHDDLITALQASTHSLHTIPGGPCKCSQCHFVRLRYSALAKAGAL